MRSEAIALLAIAACGGGRASSPPTPSPPPSSPSARIDSGAVDSIASFADLATRATSDAPLMREVARVSGGWELRADADTCLRAVFAASAPVRLVFLDDQDALRGDAGEGTAGVVPTTGPACFKKGERARLVKTGDAPFRLVVLRSP